MTNILDWYKNKYGGAIAPPDYSHVEKYPLTGVYAPPNINKKLDIFKPWNFLDQGRQNSCCAYTVNRIMMIYYHKLYNANWLYAQAQKIDEIAGEKDKGTTLRAVFKILMTKGIPYAGSNTPSPYEGIWEYRWATNVDQMRLAISDGNPVALCTQWWTSFDKPHKDSHGNFWYAEPSDNWGKVRTRHCVTLVEASDDKEAFGVVNSWGSRWPYSYIPYDSLGRLMYGDTTAASGEAGIVTDR